MKKEVDQHTCAEIIELQRLAELNTQPIPKIMFMPVFGPDNTMLYNPTLVIAGEDIVTTGNVDFCPYCGMELGHYIRENVSKVSEKKLVAEEYWAYRQRYIESEKDSKTDPPLSRYECEKALAELSEVELLLPFATKSQAQKKRLAKVQRRLEQMLCLNQSSKS